MTDDPTPQLDADRVAAAEGLADLLTEVAAEPAFVPYIDAPGVYPNIPAADYVRDPVVDGSMSSTGARNILPIGGGTPAKFAYQREHGRPDKPHLDYGRAAHQVVLGDFENHYAVIDAPDWRTKRAQQERDAARAAGLSPILIEQEQAIRAMAEQIQQHPIASVLFAPGTGRAEQTLVWRDDATGVTCRARLDWLRDAPTPGSDLRLLVPDYKTAASADPTAFRKSVATYGYHQQAAWYLDAVAGVGLVPEPDDAVFVFVVQEKDPPYLVSTVEVDEEALTIGRELNEWARRVYRDCSRSGHWPGYPDEVVTVSLPQWYLYEYGGLAR